MRIWSKKLIHVLPNKQLKAMRYELGDMIKQHPNIKHPLVKFANRYDIMFLYSYFMKVCDELNKSGINMNKSYNESILLLCYAKTHSDYNYLFNEDNDRYLKQCYYNLQEKYDRGIITQEEWEKIENFIGKEVLK